MATLISAHSGKLCYFRNFSKSDSRGVSKIYHKKNCPEMNNSEADLFPHKILSKSVENKKYRNFHLHEIFSEFFDLLPYICLISENHLRSDNDIYTGAPLYMTRSPGRWVGGYGRNRHEKSSKYFFGIINRCNIAQTIFSIDY